MTTLWSSAATQAEASPSIPPSVKDSYVKTALPILRQSCFACHGPHPQNVDMIQDPALRKKAEKAIAGSQDMFPMAESFPFGENDDSRAELKDIVKNLKKGWMPPEEQKTCNLGASLSDADKKVILDWAEKSIKTLDPK
ncbi:MAG TPA: heme-binding domain-containing protein [bacterium]|nr:heme-binding domain-containing protein [bacterium]